MQRLKALWYQLTLLGLVFRVILFEKLSTVFALAWWAMAFIIALLLGAFHWTLFVGTLVSALVLCRLLIHRVIAKKYLLIRRGDRVEYADPDTTDMVQKFETARILRSLKPEHAAKTESVGAEELELYSHFFLVDTGKGNRLIPYEWITAIETGELAV